METDELLYVNLFILDLAASGWLVGVTDHACAHQLREPLSTEHATGCWVGELASRTSPDITVAISGHPLTNTFYGAATLWLGRTRARPAANNNKNRRTKIEWAELNTGQAALAAPSKDGDWQTLARVLARHCAPARHCTLGPPWRSPNTFRKKRDESTMTMLRWPQWLNIRVFRLDEVGSGWLKHNRSYSL